MDDIASMLKIQKMIDELGGRLFEGSIDRVEADSEKVTIHCKDVDELLKFLVPLVHKRALLAVIPKETV